jgi:hypothetical protein
MPSLHRRAALAAALAPVAIAATALLAGCVVPAERVTVREQVVVDRPVVRAMPAPIREERGAPPAPGWNWVPGHWKWEGHDWAWVHGHWVQQVVEPMPPVIVEQITVAPSPRHYWVPGHWVWHADGRWVWVPGRWHS